AFEWVHVQLHQQKGMISLSPPTICNSAPAGLRSCHTAVAGNLIIEGHVPATTIHKAMQSGSGIYGLATPGMPAGSPGMEMGARKEAYDVIAFSPDGSKKVFQRIE
ncbi:DUF411 domain-containing protein, partial [Escherichia coli]